MPSSKADEPSPDPIQDAINDPLTRSMFITPATGTGPDALAADLTVTREIPAEETIVRHPSGATVYPSYQVIHSVSQKLPADTSEESAS